MVVVLPLAGSVRLIRSVQSVKYVGIREIVDSRYRAPRLTLDRDPAPSEPLLPHTQHAPVIPRHDRHNVHTGFDGQMERSLFERPHLWPICITPRAFWEDENALPLFPHLRGRFIECRVRGGRVGAIDKDGAGERHEPAEKGHEAEGAFGRDAAVRREDGAEEEDVEFGLVVPDQHARSRAQILLPRDDLKVYARRPRHGVVECSRDGPLADAVLADETEGEGGDDAVGGAEDKAAVGGEEASVEGGGWDGEVGEGEEGACEAEIEGEDADEDHEDGVHGL